jgi:hypothetical protein
MITLPELAAGALGSFLASDMKDRFGSEPFRISNDWGELGEYLDILKRSIARLNEHGHAG